MSCQRGARRRPDGERDHQLSSARQHHDDVGRARRPAEILPCDRPRAADRAGRRTAILTDCIPRRSDPFMRGIFKALAPADRRREGTQSMLQDIAGAAPAADGLVKDVTTQSFMKDVIEESKRQPVLVDFWAEWCGPCKQLTPVLEKAVKGAKGKVKLAKMDIDKHPAIPGQMGIQSIPAVIAFVNGQPADGFLGALPEGQVADFIARITKDKLGGEAQDFLKSAEEALAAGNADEAIALYGEVLREEPGSVPALAGLARAHVETGALDRAKETLALVPEAKRN